MLARRVTPDYRLISSMEVEDVYVLLDTALAGSAGIAAFFCFLAGAAADVLSRHWGLCFLVGIFSLLRNVLPIHAFHAVVRYRLKEDVAEEPALVGHRTLRK